jgi:hypothetical protein
VPEILTEFLALDAENVEAHVGEHFEHGQPPPAAADDDYIIGLGIAVPIV